MTALVGSARGAGADVGWEEGARAVRLWWKISAGRLTSVRATEKSPPVDSVHEPEGQLASGLVGVWRARGGRT
jgi:hypothetical protein